jgi:hypothetical protein
MGREPIHGLKDPRVPFHVLTGPFPVRQKRWATVLERLILSGPYCRDSGSAHNKVFGISGDSID